MSQKLPFLWKWPHRKFKESENKNTSNENNRIKKIFNVFMRT